MKEKEKLNSLLLFISYDGGFFSGWAKQTKEFTVQGYIEQTLSCVFQRVVIAESVSRLDKGVHAREFVVLLKFKMLPPLSDDKFLFIFKKSLKHIFIKRLCRVSEDFFFFNQVILKEYRYFINIGKFNLWKSRYCWEYNFDINVVRFFDILSCFQGEHNFLIFVIEKQINWTEILYGRLK